MANTTVLVLGASGMLGNAVMRVLGEDDEINVFGTVRCPVGASAYFERFRNRLRLGVDVENSDTLLGLVDEIRPDVVINCIGLVKQRSDAEDPVSAIPINALFPHRLAKIVSLSGARVIQVSTDCVFSGHKGRYAESDTPDATDLYGRSKLLGELDYPHAVTLRTSIIGHELSGQRSLIGWFLAQTGPVKGFRRAVFSGLPTVRLAEVMRDFVIPRPDLHGVYHVSADPISKLDLLMLVRETYGVSIRIDADDSVVVDRSLDSTRFRAATGFQPEPWPDLVQKMHSFG